MSHLSFERLGAIARAMTGETLGAERDPEWLAQAAGQLYDDLPPEAQDDLWGELGARQDLLNAFLDGEEAARTASKHPEAQGAKVFNLRAHDPLRAISLPLAIEIITGEQVPRSGTMRCPLPGHEERTPSCRVDDDVFFCHGCLRGGSLYDLGAHLFGLGTRGAQFLEVRRRLAAELLGREAA
jgi:hypothetical protein